jgi:hypothetical protein
MKNQLVLLPLAAWLLVAGCNPVTDLQPDREFVPESAVAAVKAKFPTATNLTFKTLEKNRVWQADFTADTKTYRGATLDTAMLAAYVRLANIPDSVKAFVATSLANGGEYIGDFKQPFSFQKGSFTLDDYIVDYRWRGQLYTLSYSYFTLGISVGPGIRYKTVSLSDRIDYYFSTTNEATLPDRLKAFIRTNGLRVSDQIPYDIKDPIVYSVQENGARQYFIQVTQKPVGSTRGGYGSGTYVFDKNGDFEYATSLPTTLVSGKPVPVEGSQREIKTIGDLPASVRAGFENKPEFAGFTFSAATETEVYSKRIYRVSLSSTKPDAGKWTLTFSNTGAVLSRSYLFSYLS